MKTSLLIGAIAACCGCNHSDGDRLARIAGKLEQKVEEVMPEQVSLASSLGMTAAGLENRVRFRFQSDRYLSPLRIDISGDESTVRLRGSVDDPVLKQRAVEIAESTVGSQKVVDEITVTR